MDLFMYTHLLCPGSPAAGVEYPEALQNCAFGTPKLCPKIQKSWKWNYILMDITFYCGNNAFRATKPVPENKPKF